MIVVPKSPLKTDIDSNIDSSKTFEFNQFLNPFFL